MRFEYSNPAFEHGIPEDFPIDQSKHSLFGASKLAVDHGAGIWPLLRNAHVLPAAAASPVPNHSGVELDEFLSRS